MQRRSASGVSVGHSRVGRVQLSDALPRTAAEPSFECVLLVPYCVSDVEQGLLSTSRYFHSKTYKRLTREFDLAPRYAITPIRHLPGIQARDYLKKLDPGRVTGNAFPLQYALDSGVEVNVGISLDEFAPGNFVLRVKISGNLDVGDLDETSSNAGQILRELTAAPFRQFLTAAAGLAFGSPSSTVGQVSRTHVHTKLLLAASEEETAEYISFHRPEFIALHISRDPSLVPDPRLTSAVTRANSELNLKSESQLLIVNAQGSTLIASSDQLRPTPYYNNRFGRVVDLAEIGLCMQQALLFSPLPANRPKDTPTSYFGALPVKRWVDYPENVFHTSVSNRKLWEVVSSSLHLKSLVDELHTLDGVSDL